MSTLRTISRLLVMIRETTSERSPSRCLAGKLIQRAWQDDSDNECQRVEIQVSHVGPDLQFATAEVESRRGFEVVLGRIVLGRGKQSA